MTDMEAVYLGQITQPLWDVTPVDGIIGVME